MLKLYNNTNDEIKKYLPRTSGINKQNLQKKINLIKEELNKRGEKPTTPTLFPGVGQTLGDGLPTFSSIRKNVIRNIIKIMKQNKVVRQANIQDKLIKTFDECIRRTHILKQCEVALTLIGKSILMDNPELNISSSKQQKGGTIDDIADKIKTMKENEYQKTKGSIETNVGFDDTHPFTLLESMINYNDILNNLNRFFIAQYDDEMLPKEKMNQNEELNMITTIIQEIQQNKEQLDNAYAIQEKALNQIFENEQLKYPETYEDNIDINNKEDIEKIIKILNEEPPLRISTRTTKGIREITNVDEKGNYVQIPTPGNK